MGAVTVCRAIPVFPYVFVSVSPGIGAVAVLLVILPFPYIFASMWVFYCILIMSWFIRSGRPSFEGGSNFHLLFMENILAPLSGPLVAILVAAYIAPKMKAIVAGVIALPWLGYLGVCLYTMINMHWDWPYAILLASQTVGIVLGFGGSLWLQAIKNNGLE